MKVSQSEPIYKAFKLIKDSPQYASLSVARKRIVDSNLLEAELAGIALEGEKKERFNQVWNQPPSSGCRARPGTDVQSMPSKC
eukprot:3214524-Rhodomonas_salina.4